MAEGTEKESGPDGEQLQKTCQQNLLQVKITPSGERSSTESLTISDSATIVINCNNNSTKSNLSRERSKTPPAMISHQSIRDEFGPFANKFNNNEINPLKNNTEKSKGNQDSGVGLDEMSNKTTEGGDHDSESSMDNNSTNGGEVDPSRRHSKSSSLPHGVKLCPESGSSEIGSGVNVNCLNNVGASSSSLSDREDDKWANLEEELKKAQTELKAKDAEVEILKGIRQQVEGELEDLTASLFEEAHKMVKEAKMKEVGSEKSLKEAKMQLEGLQAEVAALKALLITSTPSRPNLGGGNGISLFKKQHKRCPSHNHLQYGRADEETNGTEKERTNEVVIDRSRCEVDPILLSHFAAWRVEPNLSREKTAFLRNIYTEDIDPSLNFANEALVNRLRKAIEDNSIWVEPLPEKDRTNVPKECALLQCPRVCHYRMRFAFEADDWFDISQICRDRIAAVCEFLNYLRYIKNGLVKASVDDAYWEILRLRKQMTLAKLGIAIS